MARYQQTQLVRPISQYAPAPLEYMDQAGAAMQGQVDKTQLALDDLQKQLNIKGGYKTEQRAKDAVAMYKPKFDALANEIAASGDARAGARKISALKSEMAQDTEIQDVLADQKAKESGAIDELITQQNFGQHVQDVIDPATGRFKQTQKGERFDQRWYSTTPPGDRNKERQPLYQQIKPIIEKIYNEPVIQTVKGEDGVTYNQTVQEGVESENLRKERVREMLGSYFAKDPSIYNTQAFIYDKAAHAKQGSDWTADDELDATVNAFLGEYSKDKEIQKLGTPKAVAPGGTGKGKKAGAGAAAAGVTTEMGLVLNNILDRGASTAVPSTVAAIQNGVPNKDGTYTKNTSGAEMYLKVGTTDDVETNKQANQFIPIKVELEGLRAKKMDELLNPEGQEAVTGKINPQTGLGYYKDAEGRIHETEVSGDQRVTKRIISDDQYMALQPEYQAIAKSAQDQFGIDLNDKDLNAAIKGKSIDELSFINDFNIKLNQLQGQEVFTPNANDNITTTDDGKLVSKDNLTLSEERAEALFGEDGWFTDAGVGKLKKLGLITEYKKEVEVDGKKEMQTFYNIPVHNVSNTDIRNATNSAEINRWGSEKFTEEQLLAKQENDISVYDQIRLKKQNEKELKAYDKNPELATQTTDALISNVNSSSYDAATKDTLLKMLNTVKAQPAGKKRNEDLQLLKLRITDPNAFYEQYGTPQTSTPATPGKQVGVWTPTKATPLKK